MILVEKKSLTSLAVSRSVISALKFVTSCLIFLLLEGAFTSTCFMSEVRPKFLNTDTKRAVVVIGCFSWPGNTVWDEERFMGTAFLVCRIAPFTESRAVVHPAVVLYI